MILFKHNNSGVKAYRVNCFVVPIESEEHTKNVLNEEETRIKNAFIYKGEAMNPEKS